MPDYIPTADAARLAWFNNFAAKFAQYAASLGFTPADVTAVQNDLAMVSYIMNRVETFKTESREAVSYKNLMLGKPLGTPAPANPVNPAPVLPTPVVAPGILARARSMAARIKASPTYSEAIGRDLGIVGAGDVPTPTPTTKPTIAAVANGQNRVDVSFVKNNYDGIILQSQRGTETQWTQIANLRYSPYRDERRNQNEFSPDVRRYRAVYLYKDRITGQYSDMVSVSVL